MRTRKKKYFPIFGSGVLLAFFCCLSWAFFVEPNRLCTTRERIEIGIWTGTENYAKLAVVGDFHFAPDDAERAEKIVDAVLAESPDAVFLLGDYVNGHKRETSMPSDVIAKHLGRLATHVPVLAVLGNHDAYIGRQATARALREAGIHVFEEKGTEELVLKNGSRIVVGGTLDAHGYFPLFNAAEVPENPLAGKVPFVLLSHSPDVLPFLNETVDLTLCGHTHGGQICLPGGIPVFNSCRVAGHRFSSGMQVVSATGKPIFITRGLGTSVVPMRFFCPPEVAVLELVPTREVADKP